LARMTRWKSPQPPDCRRARDRLEDDALVSTFVTGQLKSLGYATLVAGNAAEALSLIERGATFDLLFTDVIMPGGMNGRQLAKDVVRAPTIRQSAIYVRLRSECHPSPWAARPRHYSAVQALPEI